MISKVADIPVLGVAVGTLMTLVVQSSSATIAVLQNFASQPAADGVSSILGLNGAISILLGDNIGTTITALLACIGQSRNAKRTAIAHCTFNISGCFIFIWLVSPFAKLIQMISPKGDEIDVISRQIANAHTAFNITMTLLWLPMIWLLVKIVMFIIPEKKSSTSSVGKIRFLDSKLTGQPATALKLVLMEILNYGKSIEKILSGVTDISSISERKKLNQETTKMKEMSDKSKNIHNQIVEYLAELFSKGTLTEEQSTQTAALMYYRAT